MEVESLPQKFSEYSKKIRRQRQVYLGEKIREDIAETSVKESSVAQFDAIFFSEMREYLCVASKPLHQNHLRCISSSFSKWKADSQKTQRNVINRSFHYNKFSQF